MTSHDRGTGPAGRAGSALADPAPDRSRRVRAPLLTIGGLGAATLALHLRDPHQQGSWGYCPLNAATGVYCPGCGGMRAVNDLTDGHVGAALSSNLIVTLLIPLASIALALWAWDRWQGRTRRIPEVVRTRGLGVLLVAILAFTVARNLPFGAWLAP